MLRLNNQKGFTAFEVVLIGLLVAMIGAASFLAYQARKSVTNNLASTHSSSSTNVSGSPSPTVSPSLAKQGDSYQGWKTYKSQPEKSTFRYPTDWKLIDQSSYGVENVELKSPNGSFINWDSSVTGQGNGACNANGDPGNPYPACVNVVIKSVEALPNSTDIFFVTTASDYPDFFLLSSTSMPAPKAGDTKVYETAFHPKFKSKDNMREMAFETVRTGDSKQNFDPRDAATIKLIMMSYSY